MMKSKQLTGLAVSSALPAPQVGRTEPTLPIDAKHKYFVGMFSGVFPSIESAISDARMPPETKAVGELTALPESSKILAFKVPPGTTDDENDLVILIVEPVAGGKVRLWSSGTDLTREQREEAEEDVVNFGETAGGEFKIFERL